MFAQAVAQTPYSVENAIKYIQNASVEGADQFVDRYAQGLITVDDAENRDRLFKIISEITKQNPRLIERIKTATDKGTNDRLNEILEYSITRFDALVRVYALISLNTDAPAEFQKKYQNYLNSWINTVRKTRNVSIAGLALFQGEAILQNKDRATNVGYVETLYEIFQRREKQENDEFWDFAVQVLAETDLTRAANNSDVVARKQEYVLHAAIKEKLQTLDGNPKEQYAYLSKILMPIIQGNYGFSLKGYDHYFEIIFNHQDPVDSSRRVHLLTTYYQDRLNWELEIPPSEYLKRTLAIANDCKSSSSDCKLAEAQILTVLNQFYRKSGQFEEMSQTAEKFQQLVLDEGPIGEALSLVVPLGQEIMRHTASGKYGDAELVVNKLRQLISERKNFPKLNAVEFHMLTVMSETATLEYDIAVGNFSVAKDRATFLFDRTKEYLVLQDRYQTTLSKQSVQLQSIVNRVVRALGNANNEVSDDQTLIAQTSFDVYSRYETTHPAMP